MNEIINKYVEKRIKVIDEDLNKRTKSELVNRIFLVIYVGAALFVALKLNALTVGIGYLMLTTNFTINSIRLGKRYSDIKKRYEKEKEHLVELEGKDKVLSKEEYTTKVIKKHKNDAIVEKDETKMNIISSISGMLNALAFFGVVVANIDFRNIWLPITALSLFSISTIAEMKHSKKLETGKSEDYNLNHDLNIDQIINEYKKEKVKTLEEVKTEKDTNVSSKNIEKVEAIVEALANQENIEEDKPKQIIKK